MLATVHLTAGGDDVEVRAATTEEIAADETARRVGEQAPADRWIAFRPVTALPADTAIHLEVGPGTPSAEGPLTTENAVAFDGRTYAPLRIVDASCGFGQQCPPGTDLVVTFDNPLDAARFDPALVHVDPPLANFSVSVAGDSLDIRGVTEARTSYTVTVDAGLTDRFGQTLGSTEHREFEIGPAIQMLMAFPNSLTTLDPSVDTAELPLRSVNHDRLRVRVFAVTPDDWTDYVDYLSEFGGDPSQAPELPGWDVVSDDEIEAGGQTDSLAETPLDLADALDGRRSVVVLAEPTEAFDQNDPEFWANRPTITWVQSTRLGLDAYTGPESGIAWVTDLRDGTPTAGVSVAPVG